MHRNVGLVVVVLAALGSGCANGSSSGGTLEAGLGNTDGGTVFEAGTDVPLVFEAGGETTPCPGSTCVTLGANCGKTADACGNILDCGTCSGTEVCGAVTKNVCGTTCVPATCASLSAGCGTQGDGCGATIDCGSCPTGQTCGGAGILNECGSPLAPDGGTACVAKTCADLAINCGKAADGCGGLVDCGSTCAKPGDICGGGGVPNVCGGGTPTCTAGTCASLGYDCGSAGDGCGGTISCGACTIAGDVCGGGGPNLCGGHALACVPKSCADQGFTCGSAGDTCGGVISCGTCTTPGDVCGGGGAPNVCGSSVPVCKPTTCAALGANCGSVGDGCGGVLNCGSLTCPTPGDVCGGGSPGKPNVCGGHPPACVKTTCAALGYNCGNAGDGCGGIINCGATCPAGDVCGGGGKPNVCGSTVPTCTPKTCAALGATCGEVGDGCSGVIDCGTCTTPGDVCGGGGTPNVCGTSVPVCKPKTCASAGATCGPIGDGCGGTINCGTCPGATDICGGGGTPNVCFTPAKCTPKTCAELGATCGAVADGCGGIITSCGTCTVAGQICGGGGVPSVCGAPAPTCVNLACDQVTCATGKTTSITGTVYDPAGKNPLYNVFVYVPNGTVGALPTGATCDKCADALSGYPLVTTTTDVNGNFELDNMPVGKNIPVVIQTGKWRRQITVTTSKCANVKVSTSLTHFPQNQSQGDIPRMALSTGGADALECLLRKIGIDDSEFTNAGDGGRITLYQGMPNDPSLTSGNASGSFDYGSLSASAGYDFDTSTDLWASQASLMAYDMVLLACEGSEFGDPTVQETAGFYYGTKPASSLQAMHDYVNAGGRVFGTHYHYYWLSQSPDTAWSGLANWNSGTADPNYQMLQIMTKKSSGGYSATDTEDIVTTFTKGNALATWMHDRDTTTTLGSLPINQARNSLLSINDTTDFLEWIYASGQTDIYATAPDAFYNGYNYNDVEGKVSHATQYASFNAPIGTAADSQCGRFVFSDIHVSSGDTVGQPFPDGCTTTTMTDQEKALEFLIFDLASRVCDPTITPPPPTCTPQTCAGLGFSCGPAADGCGNILECGTCASGTCGGGGTPGKCGAISCTPSTCKSQGYTCGSTGDGCGNILNCGTCASPATCGGGGTPGTCGTATCVPSTCAAQGITCGSTGDGCGNTLSCGTCTLPATCGGGGTPGKCGEASCTPTTCSALGVECGSTGDGCGNTLTCGTCVAPATCGGGGTPGKCGSGNCAPSTCAAIGWTCGSTGDGCGNVLSCGTCPAGSTCGGSGTPGKCGTATCTPSTCAAQGLDCGSTGDGCGNVLNCGVCTAPLSCGGGGKSGVCGAGNCSPSTCAAIGWTCGSTGDGCGNVLDCGTCPSGTTCGGGGTPGKCGSATCTPKTCAEQGLTCGSAGDGCGNVLDCGTCAAGTTCGGSGTPGMCGAPKCIPLACGGRCGPQGDGCGGVLTCPACDGGVCAPTTCTAFGANCGTIGDGCGGTIDCGTCAAPLTCGGGGTPYQCGNIH